MQFAIVTGESRGLGEAIAKDFMEYGIDVIGVSRSGSEELKKFSKNEKADYHHYSCDLSDSAQAKECFEKIAEQHFNKETYHIYLINNAGMIEPIETVGNLDTEQVTKHVQVNLVAPIVWTNSLLSYAETHDVKLTMVNITSGAAEKSTPGWSTYNSTKAAINQFTATVAAELETKDSDHQILAYSPGVMDTDMQDVIRSAPKEAFHDVEKFRQLKEEGQLRDPDTVSAVLMDLLNKPNDIENGKVYKLYDLIKE
ncbi:benzil reductase ((S)-benzoin forming) [Thalassobacillus devorans]|uniref:Benzil reductase ((S)-benzoin forming) n=1 Tax=Thalassobacillus devorans TaxID=279813 RepID=A0ABQ1NDR0_9BACI|nr:(S)-benzoin forming benzil reductase [Thalassobacillus devorans]NIK26925.1 benzil reductase ((S)-benzoin forming) [Thalassobacillus devorans]GGC73500.1 benzil reductase ((S)-benzoin forming) [Thalassobacillus devorans]